MVLIIPLQFLVLIFLALVPSGHGRGGHGHGGHRGHHGGSGHHRGGGFGGGHQHNQFHHRPSYHNGGHGLGQSQGWLNPLNPYPFSRRGVGYYGSEAGLSPVFILPPPGPGIIGGGPPPPPPLIQPIAGPPTLPINSNLTTPLAKNTTANVNPNVEKPPTIIHIHHNYPQPSDSDKASKNEEEIVDEAGPIRDDQQNNGNKDSNKSDNRQNIKNKDQEITDFDLSTLIDARLSV